MFNLLFIHLPDFRCSVDHNQFNVVILYYFSSFICMQHASCTKSADIGRLNVRMLVETIWFEYLHQICQYQNWNQYLFILLESWYYIVMYGGVFDDWWFIKLISNTFSLPSQRWNISFQYFYGIFNFSYLILFKMWIRKKKIHAYVGTVCLPNGR